MRKDWDGAECEYRAVIRINPQDAKAHNNLGLLLSDARKVVRKCA